MDYKLTSRRDDGFDEAVERAKNGSTMDMICFLVMFGPSEYRMSIKELRDFFDEIQDLSDSYWP